MAKLTELWKTQNEEAAKDKQLEFKARRILSQANQDLLETQSTIVEKQQLREEKLYQEDLRLSDLVEIDAEIESLQQGEKALTALIKEYC